MHWFFWLRSTLRTQGQALRSWKRLKNNKSFHVKLSRCQILVTVLLTNKSSSRAVAFNTTLGLYYLERAKVLQTAWFCRNCIGRAFGVIKLRFRCFLKHRDLHYTHDNFVLFVSACVIFHNIMTRAGMILGL